MTYRDIDEKLRAEDVTSPSFIDGARETYSGMVVPALINGEYSKAVNILGDMIQYIKFNCRVSQKSPSYLEKLVLLEKGIKGKISQNPGESINSDISWVA